MNAITHIVVQAGYCVFGAGSSREAAIADAAKWLDGNLTPEQVKAQIMCRPNDGDLAVIEEGHPEFGEYLKTQGGYEQRDGHWFEK